ncbi:MAG: metallophosphoesterase [Actinobacteria bacterium]|nr:MAG: metallophosphoesterase [Actinomycetota bacterium]
MTASSHTFTIAQISDIHTGSSYFDERLMEATIEEINELAPDILVVAGDLTSNGYRDEFVRAAEYIDSIEVANKIVIPGNHDARNVGYVHFQDIFGNPNRSYDFTMADGTPVRVVSVDSGKPDLNDGEVGRGAYPEISQAMKSDGSTFRVFLLHHHLLPVPGTGRERNIVLDAGDVLALLRGLDVHLVLSGHKHVPYVWPLADIILVVSGTATTWRIRGYTEPSYTVIKMKEGHLSIFDWYPGRGKELEARYDLKHRQLMEKRHAIEQRLLKKV